MLTRLTHAAIAFAITVVVYQAYVLLAAPFIEPPVAADHVAEGGSTRDESEPIAAVHKFRELLAAYFPPGHWTLTKPPITAENGQMMLVIDEFDRGDSGNPRNDGKVRVRKCAILFFPTGRETGEPPPLDAVVLEAPHGAVLQMDENSRNSLGRVQSGKLLGKITVRSDMREPGTHDDLLLTTRDVEIQEDLIYTMDHVNMQLGPHRGSGKHLEIRLVAVERSRATSPATSFGNIDSLVIFKEVQAQLSPGQLDFGTRATAPIDGTPASPVKIACGGSFRFDFPKQIASFTDEVRLSQVHPTGQLDQLHCGTLSLYLANNATGTGTLGKLQARSISAIGSTEAPVLLDAESHAATARCERIWIDLITRNITFDRYETMRLTRPKIDVELTYQGNEIHAPFVRYKAPPAEAAYRLGDFEAQGSGWFRALAPKKRDAQPFQVRWTEHMRLRRINDQPVLSLNGRPKLDMVGMGELWADYLDLYLREAALDGSEADTLPADVVPNRLVASGKIAIDSEQLHGKVKQLEVNFDYATTDLLLTSPDGNNAPASSSLGGRKGGLRRAYDIDGQTLQMLVTVRDKKPEITSIDVDGKVVFSERPRASAQSQTAAKQPLKVVADHLQILHADSPTAEILLRGKPATITADDMLIRTENLQIQRGTSSARVNAPGEIELLVDRDLSGKALASPQPATIRWQRSMELDRDRITFSGNVQIQTAEGTLNTQHMVVHLTAAVQFDGAAGRQRLEIAELACHGGANAIFSQRDTRGLTAIHTIKLEESFFANLQSGKLRGEGPGLIESVHLSDGKNPLGQVAGNGRNQLASAGRRPEVPPAQQRLRFLGVQFVRGVVGNLHRRQVQVVGDVDAVYGPVDAWEQRLALTKRGMPGPDTIWINCQRLGVAESPLARLRRDRQSGLGPIELQAEGDVTIEGPYGERGNFTTHSLLAKFDQLKNTFILEGNNQQPAKISVQEYRGGPTSTTPARKIIYSLDNKKIEIDGLMPGQFRQLSPQR